MPSQRTIAVIGHSGKIGKPLIQALAGQSSVQLRVLHRAGSDISSLPSGVDAKQVDFSDVAGLAQALEGVDIVASCIGGQTPDAYLTQLALIDAAVAAKVEYFLPSVFGPVYSPEEAAAVAVQGAKVEVTKKATAADIKHVIVYTSAFAEFAFGYPILGIDMAKNELKVPGSSNTNRIEFNSMPYIVQTYAALLTSDLSKYANSSIRIVEFSGNADEIAAAMSKKHGSVTTVTRKPDEAVLGFFESTRGTPPAFVAAAQHAWLTRGMVGEGETFDGGVKRQSLEEFVTK